MMRSAILWWTCFTSYVIRSFAFTKSLRHSDGLEGFDQQGDTSRQLLVETTVRELEGGDSRFFDLVIEFDEENELQNQECVENVIQRYLPKIVFMYMVEHNLAEMSEAEAFLQDWNVGVLSLEEVEILENPGDKDCGEYGCREVECDGKLCIKPLNGKKKKKKRRWKKNRRRKRYVVKTEVKCTLCYPDDKNAGRKLKEYQEWSGTEVQSSEEIVTTHGIRREEGRALRGNKGDGDATILALLLRKARVLGESGSEESGSESGRSGSGSDDTIKVAIPAEGVPQKGENTPSKHTTTKTIQQAASNEESSQARVVGSEGNERKKNTQSNNLQTNRKKNTDNYNTAMAPGHALPESTLDQKKRTRERGDGKKITESQRVVGTQGLAPPIRVVNQGDTDKKSATNTNLEPNEGGLVATKGDAFPKPVPSPEDAHKKRATNTHLEPNQGGLLATRGNSLPKPVPREGDADQKSATNNNLVSVQGAQENKTGSYHADGAVDTTPDEKQGLRIYWEEDESETLQQFQETTGHDLKQIIHRSCNESPIRADIIWVN